MKLTESLFVVPVPDVDEPIRPPGSERMVLPKKEKLCIEFYNIMIIYVCICVYLFLVNYYPPPYFFKERENEYFFFPI